MSVGGSDKATAADILTRMAEWFSEPDHWCRNRLGYYEIEPGLEQDVGPKTIGLAESTCLVGAALKFGRHNEAARAEVGCAIMTALLARGVPGQIAIMYAEWNDEHAKDHRDVANVCHEAAYIAKTRAEQS